MYLQRLFEKLTADGYGFKVKDMHDDRWDCVGLAGALFFFRCTIVKMSLVWAREKDRVYPEDRDALSDSDDNVLLDTAHSNALKIARWSA